MVGGQVIGSNPILLKKGGRGKNTKFLCHEFNSKGGAMKKLIPLLLILLISTALAVDMKGKIGMGVGWNSGIPGGGVFPNTAVTKLGLGERMILEPVFGFTLISESSGGSSEQTTHFFLMALFDYTFLSHEKTNIYGKAGLKFGFYNPPFGISTNEFGLPVGVGLEHFVSEHFSIDLNTISGLTFTSYEGGGSRTIISLNNQIFVLGLVWYY